ncbi:MAG: trypsin-like peptidase domain-containing protein [Candidatus Bathyarchaeota archaeon]|nr:trypsin-like peptidase domain-containing protein [Candidatus Bathyarchaeota archaeon]
MEEAENRQEHKRSVTLVVIALLMIVSLVSTAGLFILSGQVSSMQTQIDNLKTVSASTTTFVSDTETVSLSSLYSAVENSVVTVKCSITQYYTMPFGRQASTTAESQGSGFIYEYEGQMVVITNNHVIENADSITITFADGNTYTATTLGVDITTDLAVLSTSAPSSEYYPLQIASSASARVGDSVAAIGSPYGLAGTMTTGIISALNRTITITQDTGGSYEMTGLIQTSAPINSGNSGGPLITYNGQVIGITTAIVENSDGLGFAIPSDTILNVIEALMQ